MPPDSDPVPDLQATTPVHTRKILQSLGSDNVGPKHVSEILRFEVTAGRHGHLGPVGPTVQRLELANMHPGLIKMR